MPILSSEADKELLRNAISKVGMLHMELLFREAVSKNDPRPLMALVLTALPNLMSMYAQLPETDIFFEEVLKMAMKGRRNSNYNSGWNYEDPFPEEEDTYSTSDFYKLSLDHL